jgi:hypothetical protein
VRRGTKFLTVLNVLLLCFALSAGSGSVALTEQSGDGEAVKERLKKSFLNQMHMKDDKLNIGLAYWIELNRQGRIFRTSHLAKFQSGDQIRFHVLPDADAYTYIVMHQGSSGGQSVLFPPPGGRDNIVKAGRECVVPSAGSLQFDQTPGFEKVGLLVSRARIDALAYLKKGKAVSVVAASGDGPSGDGEAPSDLEKAFDAALGAKSTGALEMPLPAGQKPERLLDSPSTSLVLSDDPDEVVAVNFVLSHN